MAYIKIPIEIPELEYIMAELEQVLADVRSLKDEMNARFDAIDNILEQHELDQAVVDQISSEVQAGRDRLASMNVEDPSGDNPAAPAPPTEG